MTLETSTLRLYTLAEVSEMTGFALRSLELDCRSGRVEHVYRGRARRMTSAQINALVEKYTKKPALTLEEVAQAADQAAAKERLDRMLARDASRRTPRRA